MATVTTVTFSLINLLLVSEIQYPDNPKKEKMIKREEGDEMRGRSVGAENGEERRMERSGEW